ncbi:MAG: hypothetical protein A3B74_04365 [Candidatus Kerfeldbacteria bacterium RIFCSPHIGHO2_02_FULL_42_14]|uniref:Vitamin K epoxide reductase domain-containing protein n=1 Tax=Candidatus Kerfeldbacteria bacterium RIFCSPHIGHO2_02_FULL_42_14 TaxID=1798540 RepID=A0A1G2ARH2_9BACT|nr:MAG: hypothetical protein A3B74_04365 [Candidatus Kerfeldbacteria bacterium RIFCSPHIGHO2_02_FULL_42_14]OGY80830.1 MAG: hypothetical protein A3E60_01455 [Candidatus Kerfeldbacteria bacterium RIFCSPHIGHO2_12_FULL_42_13]OGY85002.1 MAG: hypothetical protein A3I91_00790 [Candidatus Kerfeldbacteria bacterium RIFCSPLOWO2_02_FULL_42_19]OGY86908.1 MAG: hypothetical protein A3G01_04495 [Candidatus Kerfeldbacteria bacterium RIFCSPLOWO2_12_FULL_43_9]
MFPIAQIFIIIAACCGVNIALYIAHKKRRGEILMCPIGHACDTVIHSEYSRFFGIPVEFFGIAYYLFTLVSYISLVTFVLTPPSLFLFLIVALTVVAFLFSVYLVFLQAFVLKQWCTWCFASAGLSGIIFLITLLSAQYPVALLLVQYHSFILAIHIFGVSLGLGAVIITDVFFFRFLKDLKISEFESSVMRLISQIIWFAIAVLIVSGLGLFLPEREALLDSPKFLVKMLVLLVIIVNGTFLNYFIAPRLVKISFGATHDHKTGSLRRARKLAFASGAISLVSWFSAFTLGMLHSSPFSFPTLLGIYILLLAAAVTTSQFVERHPQKFVH